MANQTMQAIRIHDYGGPEQLKIEQAPRPAPKDGEVLVRILSAGVNPADWKYRSGMMKQFMPITFPWIPGLEAAGVIESVGSNDIELKVGQAVFGSIMHSYAEYAVASAKDLFRKPTNLSFDQAASVPVGALTAWQAVIEEAKVKSGQQVLVHGGAGGVGLYAVQLARWKGAQVTATTSTANAEFVRSLGAHVIDYRTTKFEQVVKDVDVVVDTVGGDLAERSMAVIKPGGIFVTIAGRPDPAMGQSRGIRVTRSRRADTVKLEKIRELLESNQIKPVIGKIFPLAQARQAQEASQTGHGRGRITLHVADG